MIRRIVRVVVCLVAALAPVAASAAALAPAPSPRDAEVVKGIKLVEDGDFDTAILTLDAAVRRLAAQSTRGAELSQANLYLGIAYVGKGQESAAKARFRDVQQRTPGLTLSPSQYPPKVINLFEAARAERPEKKGGGSGKWLLIGGGVAAAGGGAAVAAGSGGGSSGSASGTETFTRTLCGGKFARENGGCESFANFPVVVGKAGTLEATLTWTDGTVVHQMLLRDQTFTNVATSVRTTNTSATMNANVVPQTGCPTCAYQIVVARDDLGGPVPFTLKVKHP